MFSRRDMLAATAVGGVMTAATMTTADATPVKSDISFSVGAITCPESGAGLQLLNIRGQCRQAAVRRGNAGQRLQGLTFGRDSLSQLLGAGHGPIGVDKTVGSPVNTASRAATASL
jgi:hypothetical protein